jgi:lactoylglutathione lyase
MLRVQNLENVVSFYSQTLGMRELRRFDNPKAEYTLVFLGYDDEEKAHCIEFTYNYGDHKYTIGDVFGHIAIAVEDCKLAVERIRNKGGSILREAGTLLGGDEIIAFCEDPEGNKIELIEKSTNWFM